MFDTQAERCRIFSHLIRILLASLEIPLCFAWGTCKHMKLQSDNSGQANGTFPSWKFVPSLPQKTRDLSTFRWMSKHILQHFVAKNILWKKTTTMKENESFLYSSYHNSVHCKASVRLSQNNNAHLKGTRGWFLYLDVEYMSIVGPLALLASHCFHYAFENVIKQYLFKNFKPIISNNKMLLLLTLLDSHGMVSKENDRGRCSPTWVQDCRSYKPRCRIKTAFFFVLK